MSSFCIGVISWCCFVTSFRCSSNVPLLCGIPIILPVFGCMFRQCSVGVSSSVVPCSGVSGFTVFLKTRLRCKWITIHG